MMTLKRKIEGKNKIIKKRYFFFRENLLELKNDLILLSSFK